MFSRILAFVLAVFFIPTAAAALVLFNVEQRAFNPATYKRALINENFYQKFPVLVSDLVTKNLGSAAPVFMQHLTAAQWRKMVTDLISEKQLQDMTEETVNQILAYINGETVLPQISLLSLKQSLAGPAGLNFVLTIIRSQPDCTFLELARILTTFGSGELCNPPKVLLDLVQPVIQSELLASAAAIPDELPLLADPNSPSLLSTLRLIRLARLVMRLAPLLPIGLLLVITILVVRTLKNWLIWWGWSLVLAGLPAIGVGFFGAPFIRSLGENLLFKNLAAALPPEILNSIRSIVDASLREVLKAAGWEAGALSGIGLVMVLGGVILAKRERSRIAASEAGTQIFSDSPKT
jgi:hypothetical protein